MIEFFKKKPKIATQQFRLRGDIMNYDLNKGGCNCEHEHKCDCGCDCGCGDGGKCGCKGGKMLASLLLALGIALGGFFPGYYYYQAKINANSVTVKGLAEMNVKADLAIWNLRFVLTSDDLSAAQKQIDSQRAVIYKFLAEQGFKAEEISDGRIETNDLMANPYRSNTDMTSRFILNQTVTVRSANVDLVDKALRQNGDLVAAGIILDNQYGSPVSYIFTGLNQIKPQMLEQATKNAAAAAAEFAKASSSKVGNIRRASQGVFSILPREQGGSESEAQSIDKTVRVVSTVEYWLD